jgi:hypothetical protein
MATIHDDFKTLQQRLDQLEAGPAAIGDWHRLEARAARTMVAAQNEIAALQARMLDLVRAEPPHPTWLEAQARIRAIRELMDDLRLIRLSAQGRIFEHEAAATQHDFSNVARRA